LLKSIQGDTIPHSDLDYVMNVYTDEFQRTDLCTQLEVLRTMMKETEPTLKNVIKKCQNMTPASLSLINNVVILVKLILVMPVTNATSERSFSYLRRLKSYLRSTMSQTRLNHLMLLHVHKKETDKIDLNISANNFISAVEQRKKIFELL